MENFKQTFEHTDKLFIITQEYIGEDRDDPTSQQFQGVFYFEKEFHEKDWSHMVKNQFFD